MEDKKKNPAGSNFWQIGLPMILGAGLIMDNFNPSWVWYACGISMLLSAAIFAGLQIRAGYRFKDAVASPEKADPEPALS